METLSRFIKKCWRTNEDRSDSYGPKDGDIGQENGTEPEEIKEEQRSLVDLLTVYSLFVSEAQEVWRKDVNSAIWRGREVESAPQSSTSMMAESFESGSRSSDSERKKRSAIGSQIRSHASSTKEIHQYFLKLDPKRCVIPANQTRNSPASCSGTLITVQNQNERSRTMRKKRNRPMLNTTDPVMPIDVFLNEPEKELYKRVLHCAHYPVLSSPASEPVVTPSSSNSTPAGYGGKYVRMEICVPSSSSGSSEAGAVLSPTDKVSIETEMLMKLLKESFGITQRIHNRYFTEMRQAIPQRDPSKLLLCELQERLYRLETNQHSFYRIGSFLDRDGYSKWRSREIDYTKKLIRRFWKRDLPRNLGTKVRNFSAQEEYNVLQGKLFKYEMKSRREMAPDNYAISVFPVSTAARKLLKEYGLRYGVCGLYRQISALVCMAENFEYTGWFFKCVTQAVFEVKNLLQNHYDVMVKDERDMLARSLQILQSHIKYTFNKTRSLFPAKIPFDAVSWILEMLKAIMKIKKDLDLWGDEDEVSREELLCSYFQKALEDDYNKRKELALIDCGNEAYGNVARPRVLRKLLHDIRDELSFFKEFDKQCPDIKNYLDIESVVSLTLYGLLMKDFKALCVDRTIKSIDNVNIDSEMLGLAYLFSELDKEWDNYIAPSSQKWRIYFMLEIQTTITAIKDFTSRQIRRFIQRDRWKTIDFDFQEDDNASVSPNPSNNTELRSSANTLLNTGSVIQSEGSAFERIRPKTVVSIASIRIRNVGDVATRGDESTQGYNSQARGKNTRTQGDNSKTQVDSSNWHPEHDTLTTEKSTLENNNASNIEGTDTCETCVTNSQDTDSQVREKVFRNVVVHCPHHPIPEEAADFQENTTSSTIPCQDVDVEVDSFVRGILDEILENIGLSEDEKIDLFISSVLNNAIESIESERTESQNPDLTVRNSRSTGGDVIDRANLLDADRFEKQSKNLEPFASPRAFTNSIFESNSDIVRPIQPFSSHAVDVGQPEQSFAGQSSLEPFKPLVIRRKTEHLRIPETQQDRFSDDTDYDNDDMPIVSRSHEQTSDKSFPIAIIKRNDLNTEAKSCSLPSDSFNSLSERAIRESLPKTHSDEAILSGRQTQIHRDDFDHEDYGVRKFTSQLSRNVATEIETTALETDEQYSESQSGESQNYDIPSKGSILVSGSLIDVLSTVLRVSDFYGDLCSLLVPPSCNTKFAENFRALAKEHETLKARLHDGLVGCIKELLITYADGILALDACGWNDAALMEIIDPQLVRRLKLKQDNGLISGCRHDLYRRVSQNAAREGTNIDYCPHVSRVVKYCIGGWESISAEMCTRLNNVHSLLDLLKPIERYAKRVCDVKSQHGAAQPNNAPVNEDVMKDCRRILESIWAAQANILAERIAVMLEKIVALLLSLSLKWSLMAPYKEQMKPVSVFLEHQMQMLNDYLYPVSVKAVIKALWNKVILMLHEYANGLRINRINPRYNAERFIQLMSICLKHLVVDDDTGDNLITRCRPVLLRLQLHSYRPQQLQLISDISKSMESDGGLLASLSAKEILLDMRSSAGLSRVFSGADFVQKLLNNDVWLQELAISFGIRDILDDREIAARIGTLLLERKIITCFEKPSVEDGVDYRFVTELTPTRPVARLHIGNTRFSFSPDTLDIESSSTLPPSVVSADIFTASRDYLYTICPTSCNESDLSVKVCRVIRQAGNSGMAFSRVICQDIVSILEYKTYWEKDTYSKDILSVVAPQNIRPKAFSWPHF